MTLGNFGEIEHAFQI